MGTAGGGGRDTTRRGVVTLVMFIGKKEPVGEEAKLGDQGLVQSRARQDGRGTPARGPGGPKAGTRQWAPECCGAWLSLCWEST